MTLDPLLTPCPACGTAVLASNGEGYHCKNCALAVNPKKRRLPFGKKKEAYVVTHIGDDYRLVRPGIVGQTFTQSEIKQFEEAVYSDEVLAQFAAGNYENLTMPGSTLAQILMEQLRETCYLQISRLRRAHGPALEPGGNRFPQGKIPLSAMIWQDEGNLFLTNIRLVFPSNSFTFIRMDRKLVGLKTFEDGLAIQRKGEEFATYFVGCRAHQSALAAAYIVGKIPVLRAETA